MLWLDASRRPIGPGSRLFIGEGTFTGPLNARMTYCDITDRPPENAAFARLLFSKAAGEESTFIDIDQVVITPANTTNLVQNPGFEAGLADWSSAVFTPAFSHRFEGGACAFTFEEGTLFQDVSIAGQPPRSPYLLSFALQSESPVTVTVQVQWLDSDNYVLGTPGLELSVPVDTLQSQDAFLTYLAFTKPAPHGTVKARIHFAVSHPEVGIRVDQVMLARASTSNLIQNPGFAEGLTGWIGVDASVVIGTTAYEGDTLLLLQDTGGLLWQDVPLSSAVGRCFLLAFALRVGISAPGSASGKALAKVLWLDSGGREIGTGLSLIAQSVAVAQTGGRWLLYTGVTEAAPPGTAFARVLFTKPSSDNGHLDLDNVQLGRLN